MKKRLSTILLLVISILLVACNNNNKNEEIEIEDMIGRTVMVTPGSYNRVVCIGAGALRLYTYVGDVMLLAGVEDIENITLATRPKMFDGVARPYFIAFKNVFEKLPSCGVGGPQAQTAEAEKILSCNPDIVISEYEDVDKENALQEQLGIPVITVKYGSKGVFDDNLKNSISLLGKIFNREQRATELNKFIAEAKADISNRTSTILDSEKKSVYICGLGNWGTTNHLQTAKNYEPFNVANIKNVCDDRLATNGVQAIEKEMFVSLGNEMDVIIIDAAAIKNILPLYKEDPTMFDTCKAWQEGEVYLQMAYNAYYTNIEIALINTYYNGLVVYPEKFADIEMTTLINEVTKMFLGKELADEILSYPNSFGGYQKIDTATFFK